MGNLADKASQLFKGAQNLGARLPQGLNLSGVTPLRFELPPEVGSEGEIIFDLSTASLPNPVGGIKNTIDLLKLINRTATAISNPRLCLSELFYMEAEILAANIGALRPMLSLPLVVSARDLAAHEKMNKVSFTRGAAIDPDYTAQIVAYLRSTGLGDFVAIEENSRFSRIYFSGLRLPG